ncbi:MAG: ABC transporter permease [Methylobacterium sp.]|nr:ABC transporter permease [Methylobacterium sp.]
MSLWLSQHRQALQLVLARMWRNRLATLMMLGVMGVTLSLPALLGTVIDNLDRFTGNLRLEPQITLFLKSDATPGTVESLQQALRRHPGIVSFRFVSRDQAWQSLQQRAGLGDVAAGLEKNPLPDAFIVLSREPAPGPVDALQQELRQWPGVEHAQVDAEWVKRLYTLVELGRKIVLVLFGLLGFALMAVIGNTIRLQILTQRDEIEVSKLIGATDRFIRRPFLYAGAIYGLGGGFAAWLILCLVLWVFNLSVQEIATLYASDFSLQPQSAGHTLWLLGGAVTLGWLGAFLAVGRSLAEIDSD